MTEETHSVVDVVGHNYAHPRYTADLERFPQRVVVGTETLPKDIDELWSLVTEHSHVIGDFTWTGWDYLGEAGLGQYWFDDEEYAPYPWLTAWCGDIDITGHRRPASYYREIVFGLRAEPYIAVDRPRGTGRAAHGLGWAWTDSLSSWDLTLDAGAPVHLEVYSATEEVELMLNGRSVGTALTGPAHHFRAAFESALRSGRARRHRSQRRPGDDTHRAPLHFPGRSPFAPAQIGPPSGRRPRSCLHDHRATRRRRHLGYIHRCDGQGDRRRLRHAAGARKRAPRHPRSHFSPLRPRHSREGPSRSCDPPGRAKSSSPCRPRASRTCSSPSALARAIPLPKSTDSGRHARHLSAFAQTVRRSRCAPFG